MWKSKRKDFINTLIYMYLTIHTQLEHPSGSWIDSATAHYYISVLKTSRQQPHGFFQHSLTQHV
jgi:hypothetical protein